MVKSSIKSLDKLKKSNSLVSIIIPTLNEEKYLEKNLKSLKNQKSKVKYEIIVVDGGSSDNTLKIANQMADKVVVSDKKSPSVQRNLGAKVAKGKILLFIDADTVASEYWLKNFVDTFQNPNIVGATGPLYPLEKIKRNYLYRITNVLQKFLVKINYPLFWGASCGFKTDAFWSIKGFDNKLITSEDHDISLRIKRRGRLAFNDKIAAYTSHRKFIQNEKKAFNFYLKDVLEYFFLRRIRKITKDTKE